MSSPYPFQCNLAQAFIWNHIEGLEMLIHADACKQLLLSWNLYLLFKSISIAIIVDFLHFIFP